MEAEKTNVDRARRPVPASVFEGLTAPAFLCRKDAGVVAANGPAGSLLETWAEMPLDRPAGELLGCLNAGDAGCGQGPRCGECPVRLAIRSASAGQAVVGVPVAMVLIRNRKPRRIELRVSARPAVVDGEPLALLVLEPSEWVR
jgi:hypothetical protein